MKKGGPSIKVVNTVVSTRLSTTVDIDRISLHLEGAQYEPETFPGLVLRRPDLGATMIMFATGRFVGMAPTRKKAIDAMSRMIQEVSSVLNHDITFNSTKVENMVATTNFEVPIDLNTLAEAVGNCEFDPKRFPAVICRYERKVVLLVFASGKVNCVGARSLKKIRNAISWIGGYISQINHKAT